MNCGSPVEYSEVKLRDEAPLIKNRLSLVYEQ